MALILLSHTALRHPVHLSSLMSSFQILTCLHFQSFWLLRRKGRVQLGRLLSGSRRGLMETRGVDALCKLIARLKASSSRLQCFHTPMAHVRRCLHVQLSRMGHSCFLSNQTNKKQNCWSAALLLIGFPRWKVTTSAKLRPEGKHKRSDDETRQQAQTRECFSSKTCDGTFEDNLFIILWRSSNVFVWVAFVALTLEKKKTSDWPNLLLSKRWLWDNFVQLQLL